MVNCRLLDAVPDILQKLRRYFAWIVDAMPDVAFERICCVEILILSLFYVQTEVTNLLCVHSGRPARCSVRTEVAKVLRVDSKGHATHIV